MLQYTRKETDVINKAFGMLIYLASHKSGAEFRLRSALKTEVKTRRHPDDAKGTATTLCKLLMIREAVRIYSYSPEDLWTISEGLLQAYAFGKYMRANFDTLIERTHITDFDNMTACAILCHDAASDRSHAQTMAELSKGSEQ